MISMSSFILCAEACNFIFTEADVFAILNKYGFDIFND